MSSAFAKVAVSSAIASAVLLAAGGATAEPSAAPDLPGYTMSRTGGEHDFDYFRSAWTTEQHRLRAGTTDTWDHFPATQCLTPHLEGRATVDELYMPTLGRSGLTVRLFDRVANQWKIYFISSVNGHLDPIPVVGGFEGNRGEFYAADSIGGRPIKVRYLWTIKDPDHARWEQAFSYDDRTWVTNWTADFTRADPAAVCDNGTPKRE